MDRWNDTPLIKLVWRFGGGSDRMVVRLKKPGTASGAHDLADSYFVAIPIGWRGRYTGQCHQGVCDRVQGELKGP